MAAGVLTGGFTAAVLTLAGCFAVGEDLRSLLSSLEGGEAVSNEQAAMATLLGVPSKRKAS